MQNKSNNIDRLFRDGLGGYSSETPPRGTFEKSRKSYLWFKYKNYISLSIFFLFIISPFLIYSLYSRNEKSYFYNNTNKEKNKIAALKTKEKQENIITNHNTFYPTTNEEHTKNIKSKTTFNKNNYSLKQSKIANNQAVINNINLSDFKIKSTEIAYKNSDSQSFKNKSFILSNIGLEYISKIKISENLLIDSFLVTNEIIHSINPYKNIVVRPDDSKRKIKEARFNKFELSIAAYASPVYTFSQTEAPLIYNDYAKIKTKSETPYLSYNVGVGFRITYKNFFVESGIQYSKYSQKVSFDNVIISIRKDSFLNIRLDTAVLHIQNLPYKIIRYDSIFTWVYDTSKVYRNIKKYNHFTYFEIPILVGYTFYLHRLNIDIAGGIVFGFLKSFSGCYISPDFKINEFADVNSTPLNKILYHAMFKAGISYPLSDRLKFFTAPFIKYSLNSVYTNEIPIKQNFLSVGLQIGLKVIL